jgi:hypothetical protein
MVDTTIIIQDDILREKVCHIFGSEENYVFWRALNNEELESGNTPAWREWCGVAYEAATVAKYACEEDYLLEHEDAAPFWMGRNYLLRMAPLGAIGWPREYESEIEEPILREDEYGDRVATWRERRLKRADGKDNAARLRDYSKMGWSPEDGVPVRLVTPEEDAEFERRLKANGLARRGSMAPVIGYRGDELLREELPEPEWIISKMLRASGAMMLYGPSGIGKSWATYTLLLMMLTGKGFALRDAEGNIMLAAGEHQGKRVCLVDGEMLASDIAARLKVLLKGMRLKPVAGTQAIAPINPMELEAAVAAQREVEKAIAEAHPELKHNVGWEAEVQEVAKGGFQKAWEKHHAELGYAEDGVEVDMSKLFVYPRTAQDYRASMVSLVDEGSKSPIIEFAIENKIDVMVFDNVSTLSDGLEDENAAEAFQPLNSLVVALKRHGVATVLVHHTGKAKDAKTYRGSSNLNTVLEQTVRLEAVDGPKDGARFKLVIDKNRNGEQLAIDGKTMALVGGHWVFEEDAHENANRIIEAIKTRRYGTQQQVGDALNLSQSTVSNAIKAGVAMGLVSSDTVVRTWFKEARELAKGYGEVCQFDEADGDDL